MRNPLRPCAAAALGVTLLSTMPASGADLPGPRQRWIDLRTPNFVIFSHTGEGATRAIAADLEELHAVLGSFSSLELSSPIPTYIYVFRNDRDFRPYKPLREGRPSLVSGYFAPRADGNYIAIDGNARRDATGIVYHEYVHYFVANNLPGLPLWFEEGLAELYSSLRIRGKTVEFGFPDPYHLVLLRNSRLIPLPELLTADHHSELYNERDRKSMFYAESWALVHYLLVGSDERRKQTPAFLDLVVAGVPPTDALASAFDTDERGLEKELRLYCQRDIFSHLQSPVSIEVDLPVTLRRMSHADVLYRLGDLLAQQDESRPEANDYFEAAVEVEPRHGLSWSALGVLAEQHAGWGDARSFHDRAVKNSPDDFLPPTWRRVSAPPGWSSPRPTVRPVNVARRRSLPPKPPTGSARRAMTSPSTCCVSTSPTIGATTPSPSSKGRSWAAPATAPVRGRAWSTTISNVRAFYSPRDISTTGSSGSPSPSR
jgi:hypothetical protein